MSQVTGRQLSKAWFARLANGEIETVFPFQFNPTAMDRDHDVAFSFISAPGSPLPLANFQAITGDTIAFTMLLDATENYDEDKRGTLAQQAELESYVQPDLARYINELGQFIPPPEVRLGYGSQSWRIVIPKIKFRDVRFNRDGHPTRTFIDIKANTYYTRASEISAYLVKLDALRSRVVVREV